MVALTSAIGIALGAALHNTAAAIVTYFALGGASSLLMIPAMQKAGDWVNTGQTFGWLLDGTGSRHTAQILVSAALWIALPLAIGTVRTIRREVQQGGTSPPPLRVTMARRQRDTEVQM